MIVAVFDCMVFLQAATNPRGPAATCLAFVGEGHVKLLLTPVILEEVADVLNRPGFRRSFPTLTDEGVVGFLEVLRETATVADDVPLVHRLPRDPDDEPYLNLALSMQSPYLVSWDKDLLSLMGNEQFCKDHPWFSVVNPPAFLQAVRAAITKELGAE